ncbi:hypothetical protein Ptr86124_009178 [Pyrenophora tritici-repentis]|uniref:Heterokaryon incompatibility domain-containing protein n=1 Tax=Pyrenophora tritici-repentis TaxID=45151 RepID=A0A922N583_9PLEO|nr:hypothetical protein Ptr86124_009178 [Pyrenophora tritici-repentis]
MSRAFTCALELNPSPRISEMIREWRRRNKESSGQLEEDWMTVVQNGYWTRAWITQEILLAKLIKIWVNDVEIDPHRISRFAEYLTMHLNRSEEAKIPGVARQDHKSRIFIFYISFMGQQRGNIRNLYEDRKLIFLFSELPGRQSFYIHDRVYSLLSVATDASSIKVDYRASTGELLNQLLEIYSKSMCICSWFYMSDMLDVQHIPDSKHGRKNRVPVFKIPMKTDQTEFIMTPEPKYWHHICASCGERMDSFQGSNDEVSFCVRSICTELKRAHLFVKKHRTGHYSIRRSDDPTSYEVLHFQPAKMEDEDELFLGFKALPDMWDIFLTGDVLIKLFVMPDRKVRERNPLRICDLAGSETKKVEFCENIWACGK